MLSFGIAFFIERKTVPDNNGVLNVKFEQVATPKYQHDYDEEFVYQLWDLEYASMLYSSNDLEEFTVTLKTQFDENFLNTYGQVIFYVAKLSEIDRAHTTDIFSKLEEWSK